MYDMDEFNLDQAPQDFNKEEFQLERVHLQAFVGATDHGCKIGLIRSATFNTYCPVLWKHLRYLLGAAVAEWYRYRIVANLVTSSSAVPPKTLRVGQRCTPNLSRAETSSRWCGVVVRRGGASSGVVHIT
ncbi:uncharacterized protein TNCV_4721091 [Trichonephila clavipes]|uniref:Uncharacterized protein n=1 Tax=Trichonephila clavipes TaxID=2585209 RepID=A0A8X7BEM5_TRICX|nr:uncharacterized protein TNCV_4721091 [Trichonephila clavipes]